MELEDRLSRAVHEALARVETGPGDRPAAEAAGRGLRRRRRMASGACALAVVIGGVGLVAVVDTHRPGDRLPTASSSGWRAAAPSPLSPRYDPLMAWTGSEVLVVGGHTDVPCPPAADCVRPPATAVARDAAAYDPESDEWRPIADPPGRFDEFIGSVVVDGDLVVADGREWSRFDADADAWTRLPDAPEPGLRSLTTADGLVYALGADRVRVLDLEQGVWSDLPPDPLTPRLSEGSLFATDAGLLLTGVDYDGVAPDEPVLQQVDVWDGERWRRLPTTGQLYDFTHWTGRHLVSIDPGSADGGEVDGWDRAYPNGGSLDPTTGQWSPIPGLPTDYLPPSDRPWLVEAADGPLVAGAGRVYDDSTGQWRELGRPDSPLDSELTAVWADGELVSFGGFDSDAGYDDTSGLAAQTWIWSP
ncbi:MAG: hypothetical protein F2667_14310 [Actinobacteria bacterium]|uniref:Unannotated protein n=1 Tax=freshwater metagenome TaxID=449393 RepID=A0A6J6SGL9_9ZZZZ|nr:hypothetical protein [Actinomycetota bacterium]